MKTKQQPLGVEVMEILNQYTSSRANNFINKNAIRTEFLELIKQQKQSSKCQEDCCVQRREFSFSDTKGVDEIIDILRAVHVHGHDKDFDETDLPDNDPPSMSIQTAHDNIDALFKQQKGKEIAHGFNEGYKSRNGEPPKSYQKGRSDTLRDVEEKVIGEDETDEIIDKHLKSGKMDKKTHAYYSSAIEEKNELKAKQRKALEALRGKEKKE